MLSSTTRQLLLLLLVSGLCQQRGALGATSADLVAQGNRKLAGGKLDAALKLYDQASVDAPESAVIYFNRGVTYFRKGDLAKARDMFDQAALKTKDLSLEAHSQYNLGNCAYQEAMKQADSDLKKCLQSMTTAITHYQQALKLDPKQPDAAYNIEVTRLKMKDIMDRIKKQEEQAKKKQAQQKQQMEKLKKLLAKQQKLARDARQLAHRNGGKPALSKPLQSGKFADRQKQLQQQTKDFATKMRAPKNKPAPKLDKVRKHLEQATARQNQAEQKLRQNQPGPGAENAGQAADEIKQALEALTDKKPGKPGQGKQPPKQQPKKQQPGSQAKSRKQKQKAGRKQDQTARGILNQERENRRQRDGQRRAAGYVPVDKDW